MAKEITFVIMAGGKGQRLWPLVCKQTPKVCLSPNGSRSLIQQTIDRLRPVAPGAQWLIIATPGQDAPIRRALTFQKNIRILVEPEGKNTAACIALAAAAVGCRNSERIMVAVPADHWMSDIPAFQRSMRKAITAASQQNKLVVIGIAPKGPNTGLGYLATAPAAGGSEKPRLLRLKRFIEKPDIKTAKRIVAQAGVFWNSGMFIGSAGCFLKNIAEWLPGHSRRLTPLAACFARNQQGSPAFKRQLKAAYQKLDPISFDYGVMQHLRDALVVEGDFGWEDLGSWDIWARFSEAGSRKVLVDSKHVSIVGQPERLVAVVGVPNIVVVQTPRATLICKSGRTQEVRSVVSTLSANRRLAGYL